MSRKNRKPDMGKGFFLSGVIAVIISPFVFLAAAALAAWFVYFIIKIAEHVGAWPF